MASVFYAIKVHQELCDIIETSIKKQRVINQNTYLFSMRNWYSSLTSNPCQDQSLHIYETKISQKIIIINIKSIILIRFNSYFIFTSTKGIYLPHSLFSKFFIWNTCHRMLNFIFSALKYKDKDNCNAISEIYKGVLLCFV